MGYFDFRKDKEYLICIDSDGCAMDTMDVKHTRCFGPEWIKTFELKKYETEALEYWNKLNLYSGTRGINRFKGLALCLQEMERRGEAIDGLEGFVRWTEETKELSNPALLTECQKVRNHCMELALLWSIHVNLSITELPKVDKPFPNVKVAMEEMVKCADLAVVSSANGQAVREEWSKHDLKRYTKILLSQEAGSKTFCISELLNKGYAPDKVCMVGDAPGDRDAALANHVWFYPIVVRKEAESWQKLKEEACVRLVSGKFDEAYQRELLVAFNEALGI
ncbi:MAG TPA: HAD hydrolase-like protein [Lachnospiraceae bacterium]|nr:HAD hydrolase-like protein [Lachnospiraceae bacterium]